MPQASGTRNWIEGLPSQLRETIEQRMQPRHVADGESVYAAGDPGHECYLIQSGRVRMTNYAYSGKEVQTLELREGDCFGEISLIDGLPRANNAHASGVTELRVLTKPDFDSLYAEHPEIAAQLNRFLCHRLRTISANAEDASVLVLRERLPRLIARLAESHGVADGSGGVAIERISHANLAHMLGVTRQSISLELKELERAGLIQLRYRRILVRDLSAFARRFESLVGADAGASNSMG